MDGKSQNQGKVNSKGEREKQKRLKRILEDRTFTSSSSCRGTFGVSCKKGRLA